MRVETGQTLCAEVGVNDLSQLELLAFYKEESDYGNCYDISSAGFLPITGQTELPLDPHSGDGYSSSIRHFLCRINKRDLPNLIAVLQQEVRK